MQNPQPHVAANVVVETATANGGNPQTLASGILLSERTVLVPDPPRRLLEHQGGLHVVVTAFPPEGRYHETIPVVRVERSVLTTPEFRSSGALLSLAAGAPCAATGPQYTLGQFAESLERNRGDLWKTVSDRGHSVPASPVTTLPEHEPDPAGDAHLWDLHTDSAIGFLTGICDVCPNCVRPDPPTE